MEKLLKVRRELKRKKPKFIRQDAHKKVKLGYKWRRPKGSDSKMRRHLRGYRKSVTTGYKSPADVKGLSREGKIIVRVENTNMIKGVNKEKECIIISGTVGLKKKYEIVKLAKEAGITILNLKEPAKFIEAVEKELAKKKEEKTAHKKDKEKKEKEKEEAAKKKEDKEKKDKAAKDDKNIEEIAEEDKKKADHDKKEKDKILIKKTD